MIINIIRKNNTTPAVIFGNTYTSKNANNAPILKGKNNQNNIFKKAFIFGFIIIKY